MTDLANRALLVGLTINSWPARKLDKRESIEVAARNGAAEGTARVNKSLLPMADSLEFIQRVSGAAKTYYYANTLPWVEGLRIIKSDAYIGFARAMGDHKIKFDNAVQEFARQYPQLRADAALLLGSLYSDNDYPDPSSVSQRFAMDVAFYPVPSASDWRVDLADSQMEKLRQQITETITASQARAMRETWQRLYDVVEKAHTKLSQPDALFRDSLIENIREMCEVLPTFNIADDPQLEAMRRAIEGSICRYEPQGLRKNDVARTRATDQLRDIMAKMGGMYDMRAAA